MPSIIAQQQALQQQQSHQQQHHNTNKNSSILNNLLPPSSILDLKQSSSLQPTSLASGMGMMGSDSNGMGGMQSSKSIMHSSLSSYVDPLEQSLASLESMKNDDVNIHPMDLIPEMSPIMPKHDHGSLQNLTQNIMHQFNLEAMNLHHDVHMGGSHNNGFNMDVNGLLPSGIGSNGMLLNMGHHVPGPGGLQSIFDFNRPSSLTNLNIGLANQPPTQQSKKEEKFLLTPKPIEHLLMNPMEKKMTPPDKNAFAQPFKLANEQNFKLANEQNLKNASSWSSLASAESPQNSSTSQMSTSKPKPSTDSFQVFKKAAKEKMDRMKMLEQQQLSRNQKEAAEKRQQEEKQKKPEDLINGR